MFNIGFTEFLVIGVVALIVIGPKQLPEVARVVGRLLGELKRATQDLSGGLLEVTNEVKSSIHETKEGIMKEGRKVVDSVTQIDDTHHDHDHDPHLVEDSEPDPVSSDLKNKVAETKTPVKEGEKNSNGGK